MTEQHYRLTLVDAIAKYKSHDLTVKGLVHFYVLIKCKPGWKVRLEHQKVCKELGIKKSAFYEAISRLRSEGSIDWESPQGILVSIRPTFRECGMESTIVESQSVNAESQSAIVESQSVSAESQSAIVESETLKPLLNKVCSDSPDLLLNSYQLFRNSLSKEARENFFNFCEEKAKNLSQEVNDIEAWLAHTNKAGQKRWEVYYDLFRKSQPELVEASQSAKWENHPRRDEWLAEIESTSNPAMFAGSDKEKQAFVSWCWKTKQFSWLKEEVEDGI